MKLELTDIIKRPLLSEKSVFLGTHRNAYSFQVDRRADKISIRQAIEEIYHVKVSEVRTSVVPGRSRRSKHGYRTTPAWKKAVVQVHPDHKLDIY